MKHKICTILVVFVALLLGTTPALAREHEPTGNKIDLPGGDLEYPANQPFWTRGGWDVEPEYQPGQWFMELEVDGVRIKPTYKEMEAWFDDQGNVVIMRLFYFNFPDGMTGVHTFEGIWVIPCHYALEWGYAEDCANPNADFEFSFFGEKTVTFVP